MDFCKWDFFPPNYKKKVGKIFLFEKLVRFSFKIFVHVPLSFMGNMIEDMKHPRDVFFI